MDSTAFSGKRKYNEEPSITNYKRHHVYNESTQGSTQESTQIEEEEEDYIKQFSSDQRLALPDEPICIVCGKYGEYINDETDHDVCSLQCKSINTDLNQHRHRSRPKNPPAAPPNNMRDYVASNVHAKLTNYQEPSSIANQARDQVQQMLQAHEIQVKGSHIPKPFSTYDQLQAVLGSTLLRNIESLGWSMATSVQRQAVPIGLAGRDLLVVSPTHSGKTGAFLIPLLVHCVSLSQRDCGKRRAGPYALVLAPTRELCSQIEAVCKRLAEGLRSMRTGLLIGGEPLPPQLHRLKKGVQVLIGTPGRVLEMVTYHAPLVRLWQIHMLVLDEADVMCSLGFGTQVKQILAKLGEIKQTSLYSATMTSNDTMLQGLIKRLRTPIEIQVAQHSSQPQVTATPEVSDQVRQTVIWVDNKSKAKRLFNILRDPKYFLVPILVFVESRLGSEFLTRAIKKKLHHLRVVSMHGDKTQEERALIVQGINQKEPLWDVIVSTDILARGVDLPFVRLVINYDMATTLDDYVHRIGRAILKQPTPKQQRGWAITFINEEHRHLLESFATMLAKKSLSQVTPLPSQLKRYLS